MVKEDWMRIPVIGYLITESLTHDGSKRLLFATPITHDSQPDGGIQDEVIGDREKVIGVVPAGEPSYKILHANKRGEFEDVGYSISGYLEVDQFWSLTDEEKEDFKESFGIKRKG